MDTMKNELKVLKENYLDTALASIQLLALLSIPIGFVYLLSYTNAYSIPVPLSLTELPALLLVMFGMGSFFSFLTVVYIFLPFLFKYGLLGNNDHRVFDGGKDDNRKFITTMGVPLFSFILSFLLAVILKYDNFYWVICIAALIFSSPFFYMGVTSYYAKEHRLKIAGIIAFFLLISFNWLMAGLVILVKAFAAMFPNISDIALILAIVLFTIIMIFILYFMVVPSKKKISMSFWYMAGIIVVLIPLIFNPIAVKFATASLKIMKIGGVYQTMYILKDGYGETFPCQLVNSDYPNRTVPLYVVLDIGERKFVKLKNDAVVHALPNEAILSQMYWDDKHEIN